MPDEDAFIILGQRFLEQDSIVKSGSLIKVSNDGELLSEKIFGEGDVRLKNIYKGPNGRLFLIGYQNRSLWIQEISKETEDIKNMVFDNIQCNNL